MLNKTLLAAGLVLVLSGCGPDEFDRAAERDSQRSLQSQYNSMAECQRYFTHPNDCYRGTSGFYYSPIYYPWGAVMHRDNTITYNNVVPAVGRPVINTRATSVNFKNSSSYVASRASTSRASFNSSSTPRGGFGSSASRASFGSAGG